MYTYIYGVLKMERVKLIKTTLCCILTTIIICACSFTVFAVDPENSDVIGEPYETIAETENINVTEPFVETEPVYTEAITTTEEYVETTQHYEVETTKEATQPTTELTPEITEEPVVTKYISAEDDIFGTTISPTQRSTSTVSTKRYETDSMAGTVSGACVIIGVLVLMCFIASTKLSGRKNRNNGEIHSNRR